MTKCFKQVVLQALLEADALATGMPIADLAERCHAIIARSPELARDVQGVKELGAAGEHEPARWLRYWKSNPIAAWTATGSGRRTRFRLEGDCFLPSLPIPAGLGREFAEMTRELVDYRLAQYRNRPATRAAGAAFECKVTWNQRDPILKLPSRSVRPDVPRGETDVRLPDGALWRFRMMQEFCNVARPVGAERNGLPDLLRQWFGPGAGRPGTSFMIRFTPDADGMSAEAVGVGVVRPAPLGRLVAYPTLRAAAGAAGGEHVAGAPEAFEVALPGVEADPQLFALRATGDSMNGGNRPIRDGDWLILRFARDAGLGALEGRVGLVETRAEDGTQQYQVKRTVRDGEGWALRSDNRGASSFPASQDTVVIARVERIVKPEDLAPAVGARIAPPDLPAAFGVSGVVATGRVDGHLFLCVEGAAAEPARGGSGGIAGPQARPGETAFVLTRAVGEAAWVYQGIARFEDGSVTWRLPSA